MRQMHVPCQDYICATVEAVAFSMTGVNITVSYMGQHAANATDIICTLEW
jgi:hypothetical protein